MLQGNQNKIFSDRKEKLKRARENRMKQRAIQPAITFSSNGDRAYAQRGTKSMPRGASRILP